MSQTYEQLSQARKQGQSRGTFPDWYTTPSYQLFQAKYAVVGEDGLRGRHQTIARTLARHTENPEYWNARFFEIMWKQWLSPSSPILANTGTNRGFIVSCSGQKIGDSVDSFYANLHESAMLSKYGFGCSADFSDVRARGTDISAGGKASGVVPVIQDFATMASKISQGSQRRGSIASYLPLDHGDFWELIELLESEPDGLNIGWIVTDSILARLKAGDHEMNDRLSRVLYTKLVTGRGYIFKIDEANRHRPQMYKDLGLDVKATNLCCMTADQRVVTDRGIKTVGELYAEGGDNLVMGLEGPSKAGPMLLPRPDAPIVQIETAEGYRHKVTPDHRVWKKDHGWVEAQDLVPGDQLLIQQGQGLFGKAHHPELATIAGLVAGDGTYTDTSVCIDLWAPKTSGYAEEIKGVIEELLRQNQELNTGSTNTPAFRESGEGKLRLSSAPLARLLAAKGFTKETKLEVPEFVWQGTQPTAEGYLRGLYLTDGHLQSTDQVCAMVLSSASKPFLQDIQVLWANLGVKTAIYQLGKGGTQDFGKGGVYETRPTWRLQINSIQGCKIAQRVTRLGDFREGETAERFRDRLSRKGYCQKFYATFTGLTELPNEDAYCLQVQSGTHAWTVNGMITHNTEIMLHSSEDLTYTCVLASMNLGTWHQWKDTDAVYVATVFLDCVVQEFLAQSEGVPGLEKARRFTEKGRAIGLGVMGLSTLFQQDRLPYESMEAHLLNQQIFKHLHDESLRASQWMAEAWGEPEWCRGYGVRNTHRTALAPTKSTAMLMGGMSESTTPDPGMVFELGSAAGGVKRINAVMFDLMKERGVYSAETISDINRHLGSVQHVAWLDDHEKAVFRTAFEVDQEAILRLASSRQPYLCQGQSLNFFVSEDGDEARISRLHSKALLDPNILSLYYVYSRSGVTINSECVACAA